MLRGSVLALGHESGRSHAAACSRGNMRVERMVQIDERVDVHQLNSCAGSTPVRRAIRGKSPLSRGR